GIVPFPTNPWMSTDSQIKVKTNRGAGRGVAADEMRRHNLGAVLERLHLLGPLSRSDLASFTGLNRSTIADLVSQLTALGLAEETPALATGPGRPSPVVQTRPQGAIVLAVELAVDSIAVATVGLGGHVYNRVRVDRPRGRFSPEETVHDIDKLAGPLVGSLPAQHLLAGVGVAIVGITRRSDGFVHFAPNLDWRDVPLAEMLGTGLDLGAPVMVANEADLGALGEHRRGTHQGVRHLIYVSGEVGIGTGVIIDGKPLLGSAGYAGEAGHTMINPNGIECRCGSLGCWETEAGEAALVRRIRYLDGVTGVGVVDSIARQAMAGDVTTMKAIDEVGRWLGLGIGNLINLFNPERVVLGGLYDRLYPYLEEAVTQGVDVSALTAPRKMATLARSDLEGDAPLIGAAELVLSGVIADPARAANK
ncbi:MAG: ROK family protein, partial [Acidimicrobiia bacterium]